MCIRDRKNTNKPGKSVIPENRKRKKKSSGSHNNNISSKKAKKKKECGLGKITDPRNFKLDEVKSQCKGRKFEKLKILMDGTDTKARKAAIRKFFHDSVNVDDIDYGKFENLVTDDYYSEVVTNTASQTMTGREVENQANIAAAYLKDSVVCLLYTSPSPRDRTRSRMPSSA